MKLQILVPQYKENDDVVRNLLDSIALQQNVDFCDIGVIICNDGSDVHLSERLLRFYPFYIDYYLEPHRGISGTRNACLDHATADYVMFCDADDMFLNMCGLYVVFKEMEKGFDTMVSAFVEEARTRDTRDVIYTTHEYDMTFVHGKVHRRQYLIDQGIRFKEELVCNEDSYFTVLTQKLTDNVIHCKTPFYLWKWREGSVCREPNHRLKTYNYMIDGNEYLVMELYERGKIKDAVYFVVHMVYSAYYMLQKPEWLKEENKGYRDAMERRFALYFARMANLWDALVPDEKAEMSNKLREKAIAEGMTEETITLSDWLEHIKEISNEYKKTETDSAEQKT